MGTTLTEGVIVGGYSREFLDSIASSFISTLEKRQADGTLAQEVHVDCLCREEGEYVVGILSERFKGVKFALRLSDLDFNDRAYQLDLNWHLKNS